MKVWALHWQRTDELDLYENFKSIHKLKWDQYHTMYFELFS